MDGWMDGWMDDKCVDAWMKQSTNYLISSSVYRSCGLEWWANSFLCLHSSLVDIRYLEFRVKALKSTRVLKRHEDSTSCVGLILAQAMEVQGPCEMVIYCEIFVIEAQIYMCVLDGLYSETNPHGWMSVGWTSTELISSFTLVTHLVRRR
jgi:hypothetical protein